MAIDMSGNFCPCMFNYYDSVSQYFDIIATSYWECLFSYFKGRMNT